jgi:hypothetical protein
MYFGSWWLEHVHRTDHTRLPERAFYCIPRGWRSTMPWSVYIWNDNKVRISLNCVTYLKMKPVKISWLLITTLNIEWRNHGYVKEILNIEMRFPYPSFHPHQFITLQLTFSGHFFSFHVAVIKDVFVSNFCNIPCPHHTRLGISLLSNIQAHCLTCRITFA